MSAHDHLESRRGRIEIQRVNIVQHVDQRVSGFRNGRLRKRIRPGIVVRVSPHGHYGRQFLQRIDNFRAADVACMQNQFHPLQCLDRLLAQKPMRVGNNPDRTDGAFHFADTLAQDRPTKMVPTKIELTIRSEAYCQGPCQKKTSNGIVERTGGQQMSAELSVPANQRFFEDYEPGPVYEFGPIEVTEAEVIGFAKKFDPQYIHTDPEKAARGPFGGIIASGWHTSSLMMRLYVDHYLSSVASMASPGIDELRWIKPVRPGDSLWIRVTALDARPSKSKPDVGVVRVFVEVLNQNRETVMTVNTVNLFRRRPASL